MPTHKAIKKIPLSKVVPIVDVIDKRFFNDLARSIYDSHNKRFMRLCNGTLQNGPDPTNPERPMHCGLGELWFAATGLQPHEVAGCTEDAVVGFVVKHSTVEKADDVDKRARAAIIAAKLPEELEDNLLRELDCRYDEIGEEEEELRELLNGIPNKNDDCVDDETCTVEDWRSRSKRVAEVFREAAKLLPR